MGSKAPTWSEQWGSGANGYDNPMPSSKARLGGGGSKMEEVKAVASAGLDKAKAAAVVGAQKVKSGTSMGIKWVKNQYKKKYSSSK
ncbi:hypothetical protein Acr_12g0000420 [Actinidia rufa]|uniref:CDP-diacylglycerol-glycerol-3-phosphate 3-phosphatidyltransferase n=1 Tax=Actinidia rufa TaxID=165716 RepID=A0A7J0FFP6_9ERIC|nr:hypothetical protein Acr_12g0000420 [Actinidia rufa]